MTEQILQHLGIERLNAMQLATLQAAGQSRHLVLLSPTGTGKTLAFLLPVLQKIDAEKEGVQALILAPSRELCIQIEQVLKSMKLPYKSNSCYGGHDFKIEQNNLSTPPAILVGTPGRIADHLTRNTFKVNNVHQLVLDEFDKSLEMGFEAQMTFIIQRLYSVNRKYLVSATNLEVLPAFCGVEKAEVLNFLTPGILPKLSLKGLRATGNDKLEVLATMVRQVAGEPTLIFCNHRDAVERISALLHHQEIFHGVFHGGMEQDQREKAIIKFRNGSHNVLITTDLAARGLDIPEIKHVVHYQLPTNEAAFTHRNGRTARMNADGVAYLVLAQDEKLPDFIKEPVSFEMPSATISKVPAPEWACLYFSAGKKDKVNKMDIVGLLLKKGGLKKEELGRVDVLDFMAFAAVKRTKLPATLRAISNEKLKNKKVKIEEAQ